MNWLNPNTPEYDAIVNRIQSGEIVNVWYIRQYYKVSVRVENLLQDLINVQLKKIFTKWEQTNHY